MPQTAFTRQAAGRLSRTPARFVDNLNAAAGNPLLQTERDQQVTNLTTAGHNAAGRTAEFNRS